MEIGRQVGHVLRPSLVLPKRKRGSKNHAVDEIVSVHHPGAGGASRDRDARGRLSAILISMPLGFGSALRRAWEPLYRGADDPDRDRVKRGEEDAPEHHKPSPKCWFYGERIVPDFGVVSLTS